MQALAGLLKPTSGKLSITGPKSFVFQNPDHQVFAHGFDQHMQNAMSFGSFLTVAIWCKQVVMPTAEADVAFGLGRLDLPEEEVRDRVMRSLEAVGMAELYQVA